MQDSQPSHKRNQHNQFKGRSVIVAGGGLAGISAALALARQGVQVRLLESRSRLGGRTGSFSMQVDGQSEQVDYCQHIGMGCCTNLKQLICWLDQSAAWEEHSELHFFYPTGRYQRLAALPLLPAPFHLLTWILKWPNLRWRDRLSIARGMHAIRRLKINETLDAESALDWLRDHRQTPQSLDQFWSTIIVSALGEQLDRVNLAAVSKVLQDGFFNHRRAFHLLIPKRSLDSLFNTEAAESLRAHNVDVHLETPVLHIARENGHCLVQTKLHTYSADAVVLALPWHALPRLAQHSHLTQLTEVAQKAAQLETAPITGVHTWWDRPWLDHPHAAIVGRLCQWVFAEPNSETERRTRGKSSQPYYYQIVISGSRTLPTGNPALAEKLVRDDLAAVFPKARAAQLLRCKIVTDPQAVFSIAPNSLEYRPDTNAVGNDILLAGDWTRSGWPATMEGAIISGFRAAESLCKSWGTPTNIVAPPLCQPQPKEG